MTALTFKHEQPEKCDSCSPGTHASGVLLIIELRTPPAGS